MDKQVRLVDGTGQRDPEGEAAALARYAFHLQPPTVSDDKVACQGQAQPHALGKAAAGASPVERGEDADLLLRRNAWTGITHSNPDRSIFYAGCNRDRASRRCVFDSIAEQIAQGLGQSVGVCLQSG